MAIGRVIVLNGLSSSGKTSLARAMQAVWHGPLLHIGLDTVIGMMPFAYTGQGEHADEGYRLVPPIEVGEAVTHYIPGRYGRRLNGHLADFAARLSADGFDVIVDHVITDDDTLRQLASACNPDRTYLIGVTCDAETLFERERRRGDRSLGLARHQLGTVNAGWRPYDLIVDTTQTSPIDLAATLCAAIRSTPPSGLSARPTPPSS